MFKVSEAALTQVANYFKDNEIKPVRVFLSDGCGGPQLALALDDEKTTDLVYQFDEIEFTIEKGLMEQVRPVKIDFDKSGFTISSSLRPAGGCGGCCGGSDSDSCCP